jgi:hypothetical protein
LTAALVATGWQPAAAATSPARTAARCRSPTRPRRLKLPRPDLAAYALCALLDPGIIGLTLAGKTVPDVLQFVAITALGGGAGLSA